MKRKISFFEKMLWLKEAEEKKVWIILIFWDIVEDNLFRVFLEKNQKEKEIIEKYRLNGNDYVGKKYYILLKLEIILFIFLKSIQTKKSPQV